MTTIIAYTSRCEPASPLGACACGTIIVGDSVIRVVGSVTHGALCCYRDEPDHEHEARVAERECLDDYEAQRGVERS